MSGASASGTHRDSGWTSTTTAWSAPQAQRNARIPMSRSWTFTVSPQGSASVSPRPPGTRGSLMSVRTGLSGLNSVTRGRRPKDFLRPRRTCGMDYTWQYYDVVLAAIFLSMSLGVAVGVLTPVAVQTGVVAFGVVALALIGHALFVRGPVDQPSDLTDTVDALN